MPPQGDAATMSSQRCIAMPSPAWSRRSRRRDLVPLDQSKKSATVTLGLCSTRSFPTAPLGLCSARSDCTVSLDHNKKSPGRDSRSSSPTFICEDASRVVLPPADEPGKGETQEERRPTSSYANDFELSRDEARYNSDDWISWSPLMPEEGMRDRANSNNGRSEIAAIWEEFKLECRQLKQNTTAQHRASADSGREVLDPTPIEKAAMAIVDYHNRLTPVCSNEVTVTTAVDNV